MRTGENLCKFVNAIFEKPLKTLNFVYETNNVFSKEHTKNSHTIYLVARGKGRLLSDGTEKTIGVGTILFTFAQTPFSLKDDGDLQYMYISFSGQQSDELFARFGVSHTNCVFHGYEKLLSYWKNCMDSANETNIDLISESVILYTFSQFATGKENKPSICTDIIKYIEKNYADCNLSLQSVADEFGYNSKYISRIFKSRTGVGFTDYLKNIRIKNAVFLLEQNITSIKNVAYLSGYRDSLYFSSVFKETTGITPSEFIKQKNNP